MSKNNNPYCLIESSGRWVRVVIEKSGMYNSAYLTWTNDSNEALRFSRKHDAEAFCYLHNEVAFMATVTEHLDVNLQEQTK